MQYKRTYVPTGAVQTFNFNDSHHECFGYHNVMSREKVVKVAKAWVEAWNKQHPDTWQYELVESEDAVV